jgi:hypothetical protein
MTERIGTIKEIRESITGYADYYCLDVHIPGVVRFCFGHPETDDEAYVVWPVEGEDGCYRHGENLITAVIPQDTMVKVVGIGEDIVLAEFV